MIKVSYAIDRNIATRMLNELYDVIDNCDSASFTIKMRKDQLPELKISVPDDYPVQVETVIEKNLGKGALLQLQTKADAALKRCESTNENYFAICEMTTKTGDFGTAEMYFEAIQMSGQRVEVVVPKKVFDKMDPGRHYYIIGYSFSYMLNDTWERVAIRATNVSLICPDDDEPFSWANK